MRPARGNAPHLVAVRLRRQATRRRLRARPADRRSRPDPTRTGTTRPSQPALASRGRLSTRDYSPGHGQQLEEAAPEARFGQRTRTVGGYRIVGPLVLLGAGLFSQRLL